MQFDRLKRRELITLLGGAAKRTCYARCELFRFWTHLRHRPNATTMRCRQAAENFGLFFAGGPDRNFSPVAIPTAMAGSGLKKAEVGAALANCRALLNQIDAGLSAKKLFLNVSSAAELLFYLEFAASALEKAAPRPRKRGGTKLALNSD
jgi:hypothetical protein